jgi:hypothetical protein
MHSLSSWIGVDPILAKHSRPDGPRALVFAAGLALGLALGATVGAGAPRSRLQAGSAGLRRAGTLASQLLGGVRRPHDGNSVALFELATGSEAAQTVHECSATSSRFPASRPASAVKPTAELPAGIMAQV